MTLPAGVRREVEGALSRLGLARRVVSSGRVGGGCINHGALIESEGGATFFVKWNADAPAGLFEAEADGLEALRAAGGLRVPEPIAWGGGQGGPAWLVMEHVPPGGTAPDAQARLGAGLAQVHASGGRASFGWNRDNWIGSLPQWNERARSWGVFWRDRRVLPQLRAARAHGRLTESVFDRVVDAAADALADVAEPELLHGDLWSGNAYTASTGEPVVIDPAVYEGHGEVDLAMADLFGGFSEAFYAAYDDARGISAEYRAYRKDLYQLYYLLVHVNLFGGSYEAGCLAAARRVVAALG